ncbi:unannotated protein [freshwater metagenome]|uniref:Unannotated protein n=1 Tax=freshwater metagenome TaxID=449393 RepID=A0A6J7K5V3_9ZZZZ
MRERKTDHTVEVFDLEVTDDSQGIESRNFEEVGQQRLKP